MLTRSCCAGPSASPRSRAAHMSLTKAPTWKLLRKAASGILMMTWRENLCGEEESSSTTQEGSKSSWNFSCRMEETSVLFLAPRMMLMYAMQHVSRHGTREEQKRHLAILKSWRSRGCPHFQPFCAELQHNVYEGVPVHSWIELCLELQICIVVQRIFRLVLQPHLKI